MAVDHEGRATMEDCREKNIPSQIDHIVNKLIHEYMNTVRIEDKAAKKNRKIYSFPGDIM